jgi:hypothetical protein
MNIEDRVLVAKRTNHGALGAIADTIAKTFNAAGLDVDLQRAGSKVARWARARALGSSLRG